MKTVVTLFIAALLLASPAVCGNHSPEDRSKKAVQGVLLYTGVRYCLNKTPEETFLLSLGLVLTKEYLFDTKGDIEDVASRLWIQLPLVIFEF